MNESPLTKEDRDKLTKDLLESGLIDDLDRRETLCIDIDIRVEAKKIGLPEKRANNFATYLIDWLNRTNNHKALNKLCSKLLDIYESDLTLLAIQAKVRPTISIDEARSKLLKQIGEYWKDQNKDSKFRIEFKEKNREELFTNIVDSFFNANHNRSNKKFLIFGDSGSGKSTILRELNHELIKHKNEIPIFLKLDSLHEHQTIDNWIEESIKKVYNVDEKTINTISGKYNEIGIVFLLDGFDEIEPSQQKQRATDLNEFIEKHECKTVITSQMEKKDLLLPELSNNTFAELQPLDQEQMNNYVIKELKLEDTVKTIRPQTWESLTHNNAAIEDLLKKPLFLIIATDNFNKRPDKGKTIQQLIDAPTGEVIEIENMDLEEFHDNLFEDYSKNKFRELERKNKTFSKKKIVWLAQRLNNTESTLSIENMQPTLLSGNKEKICYYILVGLIVGILCGLSTGILSEILNYDSDNSQPYLNTIYYIFFGLISGAISGLMGGMIIFWLKLKIDTQSKVTSTIISRIISWLKLSPDTQYTVISFIIGVISGIIRRLSSTFLGSDKIQIVDIIVFGIVFALIFYFLNLSEEKIESVSHQEWYFDSTRAKKSVQDGMVWAVFSGVVMWIFLIASLINRIFGFLVTEQLNNPWLNNFTKIVTDIDIQKDNIPVSLIGLLLFISVNYWLFLEITKANNQNTQEDKNRKIPREYMYFGLFIFVIIIRILMGASHFCNEHKYLVGK